MLFKALLYALPLTSSSAFQTLSFTRQQQTSSLLSLKSTKSNDDETTITTSDRRAFMNKLVMGSVGSVIASSTLSSSLGLTDVANAVEGDSQGLVDVYFGVGTLVSFVVFFYQ